MDNRIELRFKRSWDFFLKNAGALLLGGLLVIAGSLIVVLGPWFGLNLLQETLAAVRADRPVRWQATYERTDTFLKSWGLTLTMGLGILIGFCLLIVPGVLLSLYWFHAPALAAEGRPVMKALRESGEIFKRRSDWPTYFLNWLVLAVLWALGGITAVVLVLTLPLSIVYLALCYADETGSVPIRQLPRIEVPV